MTTTRFQLNSKDAEVDVYKKMPSAEPNKKYVLTLEQVVVPELRDSIVLNTALFTLERRVILGLDPTALDARAPNNAINALPLIQPFIPNNVKTEVQFVFQLNEYFRNSFLRTIGDGSPGYPENRGAPDAPYYQFDVPGDYAVQVGEDWYFDCSDLDEGERVKGGVQAIMRPDGTVGFHFSTDALKLFVVKFTEEGKRVFGYSGDYLAMNNTHTFVLPYINPLTNHVEITLPLEAALSPIEYFFQQTIFTHHRHELVLQTTLPLNNLVEVHNHESKYQQQLASYRFPNTGLHAQYINTLERRLIETRENVVVFEEMKRTHNTYLLSHTDLQNFHVKLVERNYIWNNVDKKFNPTEGLYPLDGNLWYLQFTIAPI